MTYTTISGDMWDSISYKVYGTDAYVGKLMAYNPAYLENNFIFPAGIDLFCPEIDGTEDALLSMLPPWRRS